MNSMALIASVAREEHPLKSIGALRNWARFLLNGYRARHLVEGWAASSNRLLLSALKARPRMIGAFEWPYINRHWDAERRYSAIGQHYDVASQLPLMQLDVSESLTLCDLGETLKGLAIVMDRPNWFLREGELAVNLFLEGTRVYTLAFTLGTDERGAVTAYIGAIQGRDIEDIEAIYRDMTKRLYGARPRDFLISVFQVLCEVAGIDHILAVSEESRIHRHPYFKGKPVPGANYDAIWQDRGGVSADGGFFELPPRHVERAAGEIPPNKRSMYRKRYALLENVKFSLSALKADKANNLS